MNDDTGSIVSASWQVDGVVVVSAVDGNGATSLWVLTAGATSGTWIVPDHEHEGPLPASIRRRLATHREADA